MKKTTLAPVAVAVAAAVDTPKAEAIEKLARHAATVKTQLEAAQAQLKAAVSPGKYALNFQVNALKKAMHQDKAEIVRLKKAPTALAK